ncbi:MAG: aminopeptidase P family protein [Oscillospiraceae bacterium]|nr:aminopeptidase P family protein [Oscillospiraceae bacterium]
MNRLEKLVKKIPDDIDGVLITSPMSQLYLTQYNFTDGYVLVTRNKSYVFADGRYIEAAKNQITDGFEIVLLTGKQSEYLGKIFEKESIKSLGFEDTKLECSALEKLKETFSEMEFKPIGNLIYKLREYKDICEVEKIKAAQRIADAAFDHIVNMITPETTETEISLELEYFMRRNGSQGTAFDIIAVSGSASAQPHGVPRNQKLERGFLVLDYGAVVDGYRSDMTRTVFIGKANDEEVKIYNTVLEAQLKALGFIAPYVKSMDADKAARDVITNAGYGEYFTHSLGHGVGLEIHEGPRVAANAADVILESGHVITVEPAIYLAGKLGVRIEDMVLITETGTENLTTSPKHLMEIL